MSLLHETDVAPYTVHVNGGGVPGGHRVITRPEKKTPLVPPMHECSKVDLRHDDVVADIGAYVGTFTLRAARFPVRKVLAFEPTPQTFQVLKDNVADLPNVNLYNAAVVGAGHQGDTADLHISRGIGVTNSVAKSRAKAWVLTVPAVRYEEAVREATVVKVDVEGLEYTYRPFIRSGKLRALILEFHPIEGEDWHALAESIMAEVEAQGFTPVLRPSFASGWSLTGTWVREVEETESSKICTPLMEGVQCCGCGATVQHPPKTPRRVLCPTCWDLWHPSHREGFHQEQPR